MSDYKEPITRAFSQTDTFVRLTLSRKMADEAVPWIKITVRPVMLRGRRELQFTWFDSRKAITKNFPEEEALARLDEALGLPFTHIHLQSTTGDLHVRITRKGKALLSTGKPSHPTDAPTLEHNRPKNYLLGAGPGDEFGVFFLQAIGITDQHGNVRPSMQAKFHQLNEFLRIIDQILPSSEAVSEPLHIIDCGCGSAYLTFAAYYYLRVIRGLEVRVTGIDTNHEVIEKCLALRDQIAPVSNQKAQASGSTPTDLNFHVSAIRDFTPDTPPAIVLSLHACDLATDEAIARGIIWKSRLILAAPCCQHELHNQLNASLFRPVLRHGILKERLADLLTDTFRALVLRIMGYQTSVIEFISPEHTPKNLMIRAQRIELGNSSLQKEASEFIREYKDLKEFWNVRPAIEEMLGEMLIMNDGS